MRFKTARLEDEFRSPWFHPETRRVAMDFENWSHAQRLPEPLVSEIFRSNVAQSAIYFEQGKRLQDAAQRGKLAHLDFLELATLHAVKGLNDAELREWASTKMSWHCAWTAVDFSSLPYAAAEQQAEAGVFFRQFDRPTWESLVHRVVGARPHFHLARRDQEHRNRYEAARRRFDV